MASVNRRSAFQGGVKALTRAGIHTPCLDAAVLLGHATSEPPEKVLIDGRTALSRSQADRYAALIQQRCARKAVSRLVGEREFYSRTFLLTDDVLDPRPDTEVLVREAICSLQISGMKNILDIGTGSGAIAVSVAAEVPGARVTATDVTIEALAVAAKNACRHRVRDRLNLVQMDLLSGIREKSAFDLILCNPPYIASGSYYDLPNEVRSGDPFIALVPGPEGTEFYPALAEGAMNVLTKGGRLMVEVGAGQAANVAVIFSNAGLRDIRVVNDLAGIGRVVTGRREHA